MKKAFVAAAALLLFASAGMGQYRLELDLDGNPMNGVDYIQVNQSDYVGVDIWLYGPQGKGTWVWGAFICNFDRSLEYQGFVAYSPGGGWSFPFQPPDAQNCITAQGQNLTFDVPIMFPYKVARVTYHAAVDQSIDDLYMLEGSGVLTLSFYTYSWDNNGTVLGTVQIGSIATEETNWGAVKSLFR
ncbi:MAG: hypothetical protein FJY73_04810 [Candidatus Eisenbacteria bacterium]|nr:hypothetical protein [Candidatus Eisenbacteria bacterium]